VSPIPTEIGTSSALALLYLTIPGSLLAFSAYAYLLRTVRPGLALSYAYVNPMVAVLLGIWLGGETLGSGCVDRASSGGDRRRHHHSLGSVTITLPFIESGCSVQT
jgi:hypothetical protein